MPLFDPDDIAALLVKKLGLTQAAAARSRASWSRAGMKPDARFASGGGEAAGPVSWLDDVVGKTGNGSVIGAADLAAIASEFLVEERESRESLPRQLRVTLTFHGEPRADELAAALRARLASPRVDPNRRAVTSAIVEADGDARRVVLEAVVATSALQDERDAQEILARGLKGSAAAEAWTRSAQRLTEAAVSALCDISPAEDLSGLTLPSGASSISLCAEPFGIRCDREVIRAGPCARLRPAAPSEIAVAVTLAGQADPDTVALGLREAQDHLRRYGRNPEIPTYPTIRAEDGERTSILLRVRPAGETFAGPHEDLLSALVVGVQEVALSCELTASFSSKRVTAVAWPL